MTAPLAETVASMSGPGAPPRDNGELVFSAPWEARTFALAVATVEQYDLPWDAFRVRLVEATVVAPDRPYYESWSVAVESLLVSLGLVTSKEIDAAASTAAI